MNLKPEMAISTYLLIITLNVNGLNAPIKRHRVTERIKKQDLSVSCLQETHFKPKDIQRLKVKAWKKIFHANKREKKAAVIDIGLNLEIRMVLIQLYTDPKSCPFYTLLFILE